MQKIFLLEYFEIRKFILIIFLQICFFFPVRDRLVFSSGCQISVIVFMWTTVQKILFFPGLSGKKFARCPLAKRDEHCCLFSLQPRPTSLSDWSTTCPSWARGGEPWSWGPPPSRSAACASRFEMSTYWALPSTYSALPPTNWAMPSAYWAMPSAYRTDHCHQHAGQHHLIGGFMRWANCQVPPGFLFELKVQNIRYWYPAYVTCVPIVKN